MLTVPCNAASHEARKGFRQPEISSNGKSLRACVTSVAGTANAAGIPNIIGYTGSPSEFRTKSGACYASGNAVTQGHAYQVESTGIDASRCSSIYGASSTVMPESVNLSCIIYLGK